MGNTSREKERDSRVSWLIDFRANLCHRVFVLFVLEKGLSTRSKDLVLVFGCAIFGHLVVFLIFDSVKWTIFLAQGDDGSFGFDRRILFRQSIFSWSDL